MTRIDYASSYFRYPTPTPIQGEPTFKSLKRLKNACCFSLSESTFKAAIQKGFLKSFPGLTPQLVDKFLPPMAATAMDRLTQEKQHLQSTKTVKTTTVYIQ